MSLSKNKLSFCTCWCVRTATTGLVSMGPLGLTTGRGRKFKLSRASMAWALPILLGSSEAALRGNFLKKTAGIEFNNRGSADQLQET